MNKSTRQGVPAKPFLQSREPIKFGQSSTQRKTFNSFQQMKQQNQLSQSAQINTNNQNNMNNGNNQNGHINQVVRSHSTEISNEIDNLNNLNNSTNSIEIKMEIKQNESEIKQYYPSKYNEIEIPTFKQNQPRSNVVVDKLFKRMKPTIYKGYKDYTFGKQSVPLNLPFTVTIHLPNELILQSGKKSVEFSMEPTSTVDDLLKKFFDLFGSGIIKFRSILLDNEYAGLVLLCCLNDSEELVDPVFQFITIHNIETEFLNAFIQTHGTNNKLLTGILEHWIFEKEKHFLDVFLSPVKMRAQSGMLEIEETKMSHLENLETNMGFLTNTIRQ